MDQCSDGACAAWAKSRDDLAQAIGLDGNDQLGVFTRGLPFENGGAVASEFGSGQHTAWPDQLDIDCQANPTGRLHRGGIYIKKNIASEPWRKIERPGAAV